MKISYNWLQKYFEDKLPIADRLATEITFHACEVEGIEKMENDSVIDINVLPDRAPYGLCHRGIAGEVASIFNLKLKKQETISLTKNNESGKILSMKIEDDTLCPRYCARYINNLKISDSPDWLRQALESLGQRSINSIVDITNYVMFDIGEPLHAFDADKIKGTFVIRRAKAGETITLLDGKEVKLDETMLIEADDDGLLAIAGIKGGKRAEISQETKNIMLVGGNFNPVNIRKTSTKIGIRSDASKRFENGLSIDLPFEAVNYATKLIMELSTNSTFGPLCDIYPKPIPAKIITAKISDIVSVLGIDIGDKEVVSILENLGLGIVQKGDTLTISVPPSRLDIRDWRDLPEEVGRMYGYDKIKANNSVISALRPKVNKTLYYAEKIKNFLIKAGFSEVYTYSLVAKGVYEIEKPLAADKDHLRTNLTEGISKSLELNARNADLLGLETINIFEVGKVFSKEGEYTSLSVGIKNLKKKQEKEKEKIKKVRDELFGSLSAKTIITCSADDSGGLISIGGEIIGQSNNSEGIFEINLDKLVATLAEPVSYDDLGFGKAVSIEYKRFSQYPFIVRDIAVFVQNQNGTSDDDLATKVWQVIEKGIAAAGASDLLVRHSLFDTFKKDGKVSYAFRMVFQSMEKTLTDDEANLIMEKIYGEMKKNGWEVR